MPFCHAELRIAKPKSERYPKQLNTLGDHIRARRIDLGLLQRQVADQIGIYTQTLTQWERNTTGPAVQHIPAIIRFLDYDPSAPVTSLLERLRAARRARGLTQRQFAHELGVDPATICDWENGVHEPSRKKRELIDAFLR